MGQPVVHFEIGCRDREATEKFFTDLFGWGVTLRYGLSAFHPFGKRSLASSSEMAGTMMTSSPSFQLTGVATW